MDTGDRIRKTRREKGLSQERLSVMVGLSREQIAKIEQGARELKVEQLRKIAQALGVSPMELIQDVDLPAAATPPARETPENSRTAGRPGRLQPKDSSLPPQKMPAPFRPAAGKIDAALPGPCRVVKFIEQPVGAGETLADGNVRVTGAIRLDSPGRAEYALLARGCSMEPDILDGSLLLVRPSRFQWKSGDICVVYLRDTREWTVKQVRKHPSGLRLTLVGKNTKKDFSLEQAEVQGVVEEIIRDPADVEKLLSCMTETGRKEDWQESKGRRAVPGETAATINRNKQIGPGENVKAAPKKGIMDASPGEGVMHVEPEQQLGEKLDRISYLIERQIEATEKLERQLRAELQEIKKNTEESWIRTKDLVRLEMGEIGEEELENRLKKPGR
jgi:transcriptional regulator with XRE-family HTH domain